MGLDERKPSNWKSSAADRQRVEGQALNQMQPEELKRFVLEQEREQMKIMEEVSIVQFD